jgi:hypothetical protein
VTTMPDVVPRTALAATYCRPTVASLYCRRWRPEAFVTDLCSLATAAKQHAIKVVGLTRLQLIELIIIPCNNLMRNNHIVQRVRHQLL